MTGATAVTRDAAGRVAGAAPGVASRGFGVRTNTGTFEVVPRDASARWRVVDGRTVQRSLDAGATWANQYSAEDGVMLTAGAAPTPTVCWLVGRAGVIVLTTDGRDWQRVKFPEPVDLDCCDFDRCPHGHGDHGQRSAVSDDRRRPQLDAAVDQTRSLLTNAEAVTVPITKDTKPTMTAKKHIWMFFVSFALRDLRARSVVAAKR